MYIVKVPCLVCCHSQTGRNKSGRVRSRPVYARVCLPIPFDLLSHSDFQEPGTSECYICSFYAFINNKMADRLGWEMEATLAPLTFRP